GHRVRLEVIERDVDHQRIVVYTMNALDEVKSVGMRLAAVTKPGLIVKTRGVGDERVSLPVANGVAHPGGPRVLHVPAPVRKNLPNDVAVLEKHEHAPRRVDNLQWVEEEIDPRQAGWEALEIGIVRVDRRGIRSYGPIGVESLQ